QLPVVAKQMRKGALEVDAYSRDDSTKIAAGKLLTIDNQIDQTTGTGRLKAVFPNEDSVLWPNQFVNIHLLLETRKNATVVPSAALQQGPQGTYVYVVKPDNTVDAREVTVATTEGNLAQIASGVSPDEIVVTDGQDKLQKGSHVDTHPQGSNGGAQNAGGPDQRTPTPGNPGMANPNGNSRQQPYSRDQHNRQGGPPNSGSQTSGKSSR
ncbi:MAG TPA: efflux RND transporter periplasmic adaptor subunit, partial [Terriglobales bacterium]|nr:efflux RND transporter periplasmic adaptor subunit [Terriglobales bacterium]